MFERKQAKTIIERLTEKPLPLMQVLVGPRQTGKSTMLTQALSSISLPSLFVSADDLLAPDEIWLRQTWQDARNLFAKTQQPVILILDEIQKVPAWPSIIKGMWDQDRRENNDIRVCLSGSSSLLLRKGLEDSLMGRFEIIRSPHWSFAECEEAFGTSLDEFLFFGGFPAAQQLRHDFKRWQAYMLEGIIEPTIAKDVLEDEDVRKPALLKSLFYLGARFSSQELSYNKIAGQLQDSGNLATLAHYVVLLDKAGMLCALEKYHPNVVRQKKSSPRFLVYDQSLMTAVTKRKPEFILEDSELKGHLIETCVGAHLLALSKEFAFELTWWREGTSEVDFVLHDAENVLAIEVKSGRMKPLVGMRTFLNAYPQASHLVVGGAGSYALSVEDFLRHEGDFLR